MTNLHKCPALGHEVFAHTGRLVKIRGFPTCALTEKEDNLRSESCSLDVMVNLHSVSVASSKVGADGTKN